MVDNFYCSQKFTSLSVDLEKRLLYSCCSASPEKIDLAWLRQNPGQLFNSTNLQNERQAMLDNLPVASCEQACWTPESQGLESPRQYYKTYELTRTDVKTTEPETLNIILGSTCNLTCSYCCKQYSTAWTRDIEQHGAYLDSPRFTLTALDKILSRVSQNEHEQSEGYDVIVKELSRYKNLKDIVIDGGEPFLYNSFPDLLNQLSPRQNVRFFTGLGVNSQRLRNQLAKITQPGSVTAVVSAENLNSLYEFNRYNNTYEKFLENLKILQDHVAVKFSSVISNLTIHGLADFVKQFPDPDSAYNFCTSPDFLNINVLDQETKLGLIDSISKSQIRIKENIIGTMMRPCTESQRQQLASYLGQYAQRRNLALDVFPLSMLQWLNLK